MNPRAYGLLRSDIAGDRTQECCDSLFAYFLRTGFDCRRVIVSDSTRAFDILEALLVEDLAGPWSGETFIAVPTLDHLGGPLDKLGDLIDGLHVLAPEVLIPTDRHRPWADKRTAAEWVTHPPALAKNGLMPEWLADALRRSVLRQCGPSRRGWWGSVR